MIRVKVGRKGQIAVPAAICEQLGIQPGDHVLLEVRDGQLVLAPEPQPQEQEPEEPPASLPPTDWAAPLVGALGDIMTDEEVDAYWASIIALRQLEKPRPIDLEP